MTETGTLEVAERADVVVRELRESDLPVADAILRSAFDTFTGVTSLFGDKNYVRTRWLADPDAAFAAEREGPPRHLAHRRLALIPKSRIRSHRGGIHAHPVAPLPASLRSARAGSPVDIRTAAESCGQRGNASP